MNMINCILKLRPIVSSIGTFNYNLARFLCDLLSPLVPNDYSCKDTFSFVSQIKNVNLSKKFLVSYDVTSLFTNIPLQETIDIAINLIFNQSNLIKNAYPPSLIDKVTKKYLDYKFSSNQSQLKDTSDVKLLKTLTKCLGSMKTEYCLLKNAYIYINMYIFFKINISKSL